MKRFFSIYIILTIIIISTHASLDHDAVNSSQKKNVLITRGDINILEATENIRFLSQEIVKEYLFLFNLSEKEEIKENLNARLRDLTNNLKIIEKTTKDNDTKDILDFLSYSKDQISKMFVEKLSQENAALLLDYSETLLEGADSIASTHMYDFTSEEKMLITTKKMGYLLERIMKYYIALHMGFNNSTNKEQLKNAILKFDRNLHSISLYKYPQYIAILKTKLIQQWGVNKIFLEQSDKIFIPQLMDMSAVHLEALIAQITLYHNQNQ